MTNKDAFLSLFTEIDNYEDCPVGVEILTWDGCDFGITYVDMDADSGLYYNANNYDFISFFELPSQDEASLVLGSE